MNIRFALLAALVVLTACATRSQPSPPDAAPGGPQPRLAGPVKDVPTSEMLQYWRIDHTTIPHDVPPENGCMRVQAIIDSDGRIFEPKTLALVGTDFPAWLPGFLSKLRFDPAPENAGRTPIRTVLIWTFDYRVETQTVSAASYPAAMKAAIADGPPPASQDWNAKCKAEMDKQMGVTATTVSHP